MSVQMRKAVFDCGGYYILVNKQKYYLQLESMTTGLKGYEDSIGSYVIINNVKYYIYIFNKNEVKEENNYTESDKIEVLLFDGLNLTTEVIKPGLKAFQKLVGGRIESPYFGTIIEEKGIVLTINEESCETSPTTLLFKDKNGVNLGQVYGPIVFSRVDNEGKSSGLSQKDIVFIKKNIFLTDSRERDESTGNLIHSVLVN